MEAKADCEKDLQTIFPFEEKEGKGENNRVSDGPTSLQSSHCHSSEQVKVDGLETHLTTGSRYKPM